MNEKFAVFILTHGRAGNVITTKTLRNQGYTGEIYYIVDDEDEQIPQYQEEIGKDNVLIFNKKESLKHFDIMDNFHDFRAVVYARNVTFDFAKKLGITHFLELDDDYTVFSLRYENLGKLKQTKINNLDKFFSYMLEFLDVSGAQTVALGQGGDFIGGVNSNYTSGLKRKAMNAFFCRTDRPFKFSGTINEDTTMYVDDAVIGKLNFTYMHAMINQLETQSNNGGLTDIYLDRGTYVKSFYTVMAQPSAVKVAAMGDGHYRLHHQVNWNGIAPKILNQKYRKE